MPICQSSVWYPCCDPCLLHSDDFDRADSDDMGDGWTEELGDCDIKDNQAVPTQDDTVVVSDWYDRTPSEDGQVVQADITINEIGVQGRILGMIVVNEATDRWWYAQLELISVTKHRLSLFLYEEGTGHTEHGTAIEIQASQNTQVFVRLCIVPESAISDHGYVTAQSTFGGQNNYVRSERILIGTHEKAGFGCGVAPATIGNLKIDNWEGRRSSQDDDHSGCLDCTGGTQTCTSCSGLAPTYVLIDIDGISGGDCCDGDVSDGAGFNTAHIATFGGMAVCTNQSPTEDCYWGSGTQVGCTGTPTYSSKGACLTIDYDAVEDETTIEVQLVAPELSLRVKWQEVVSGKPDCVNWDEYTLDTIISDDGACTYTGATAKITAI